MTLLDVIYPEPDVTPNADPAMIMATIGVGLLLTLCLVMAYMYRRKVG